MATLRQKLEQLITERTFELNKTLVKLEELKDRLRAENVYLKEEIKQSKNTDDIISQRKTFEKVLSKIQQVPPTNSSVLISGESGTGKELLARGASSVRTIGLFRSVVRCLQ